MAIDKEKVLETAQKYADRDQYEKAIKEIQKLGDGLKTDCRALLKLSGYYEKLYMFPEAIGMLNQVVDLYRTQGAYQKALAVLKQAQKIEPKNVELMITAAELYNALGLVHEAELQLRPCLNLCDPETNPERYGHVIQMLVRVDSENLETRKKYAAFLLSQGDVDGAIRQHSLALAQLLSKEKYVDYVQTAREYLKISPCDTVVIKNLAEIYIRMNRYNDAIVIMKDLEETLRTPEIHELLVKCYMALRRQQDALIELKHLARKLQGMNAHPDVIEDVWLRAQQINPNDQDVMCALGGEVPFLNESVLNFVSSSVLQPIDSLELAADKTIEPVVAPVEVGRPAYPPQRMAPSVSPADDFRSALEAYHEGDLQRAIAIGQRVIAQDEAHLPTLRLLSELYDKTQNMNEEAQVERKIAKAVVASDKEEAVRHVLKAERCVPHSWDNYNLMISFGLNPNQYGIQSPSEVDRTDAPTPVPRSFGFEAQRPASPEFVRPGGGVPPIPNRPVGAVPPIPVGNAVPPIPSRPVGSPPPIPGRVGQPLPKPGIGMGVPPIPGRAMGMPGNMPLSSNSSIQPPRMPRKARPTVEIPEPMQNLSNDVLADLRKLESVKEPAHVTSSVAMTVNTAASYMAPQDNTPVVPMTAERMTKLPHTKPVATPAPGANMPQVPQKTNRFSPDAGIVSQNHASVSDEDENNQSRLFSDRNENEDIDSELDDIFSNLISEEPDIADKNARGSFKPVANIPEAALPEHMRQHVLDTLREIDFYCSIGLSMDANRLLYSLIDEFGDIDIIHDKKIELGLT